MPIEMYVLEENKFPLKKNGRVSPWISCTERFQSYTPLVRQTTNMTLIDNDFSYVAS